MAVAKSELNWRLEEDAGGSIIIIFDDGERRNLGPRDDVYVSFSDRMGDDPLNRGILEQPDGYDDHADPGGWGKSA